MPLRVERHLIRNHTLNRVLLITLVIAAIGGCRADKRRTTLEVELDTFSGRPNPRWSMTDDQASAFTASVDSLVEEASPLSAPGLGYRGFVVTGGERTIRVYRGRVVIERPGSRRSFLDTKGIETRLAAQARSRGFGG